MVLYYPTPCPPPRIQGGGIGSKHSLAIQANVGRLIIRTNCLQINLSFWRTAVLKSLVKDKSLCVSRGFSKGFCLRCGTTSRTYSIEESGATALRLQLSVMSTTSSFLWMAR